MGKNIGKNISNNLNGKYSPGVLAMREKLLDHAKKSATDELKTPSKRVIQKTAEATGDLIDNKLLIKEFNNKRIYKQLQMNMIKKYLKKDIYIQKKDKKLLMN